MEEEAADYIATMTKPVVSFIAGRSAPSDRRMGHAGAIVTGDRGSGASKVAALRGAGVTVVDVPSQIAAALNERGVVAGETAPATSRSLARRRGLGTGNVGVGRVLS